MLISLIRTILLYIVILIGVRIMGKRQISQLQTSELVVTLLISELAVMPIQSNDEPILNGLLPIIVLILCEIIVSLVMLKSGKFRRAVCGKPIVVIENGRILQDQMRKLRMSTEDLFLSSCAKNDVFYLQEIAYAIIETNGMMSVIKNPEYDFLTPKRWESRSNSTDSRWLWSATEKFPTTLSSSAKRTVPWVLGCIAKAGLSLQEVFLMTARMDGTHKIIREGTKKGRLTELTHMKRKGAPPRNSGGRSPFLLFVRSGRYHPLCRSRASKFSCGIGLPNRNP